MKKLALWMIVVGVALMAWSEMKFHAPPGRRIVPPPTYSRLFEKNFDATTEDEDIRVPTTVSIDPTSDISNTGDSGGWVKTGGSTIFGIIGQGVRHTSTPSILKNINSTVAANASNDDVCVVGCANTIPNGATVTGITIWLYTVQASSLNDFFANVVFTGGNVNKTVSAPLSNGWVSLTITQSDLKTANGGLDLSQAQIASLGLELENQPDSNFPNISNVTVFSAYMDVTYTGGGPTVAVSEKTGAYPTILTLDFP